MKTKLKNQKGFTIIEVLIVLAIAGLILLIVFLAVPALQRNSRNTQRRSDIAGIQAATANFASNNNGSLPTQIGYVTADTKSATVYCNGAAPAGLTTRDAVVYGAANCANTNTNYEQSKVGFYDLSTSVVSYIASASAAPTVTAIGTQSDNQVNVNSFIVNVGYACPATAGGAAVATPRSVSIWYVLESGSGNGSLQCIGA